MLQTLCEKGLSAMESSHKRIISDLEVKHKSEISRLLNEKETALAEETQVSEKSFLHSSDLYKKKLSLLAGNSSSSRVDEKSSSK